MSSWFSTNLSSKMVFSVIWAMGVFQGVCYVWSPSGLRIGASFILSLCLFVKFFWKHDISFPFCANDIEPLLSVQHAIKVKCVLVNTKGVHHSNLNCKDARLF